MSQEEFVTLQQLNAFTCRLNDSFQQIEVHMLDILYKLVMSGICIPRNDSRCWK
jgi:hypothetical protein